MALKIGVQLQPQATTTDALRDAWRKADAAGADSIWVWDHFYPLHGDPEAAHFEGYSLLAAMAVETSRAAIGAMVTCNSYRNPELLADMARTIDHLSGGRFILGIGSGWFERDYTEYGYEFGTGPSRLRDLAAALPRIQARLAKLNPPPVQQPLPLLIGGSGEKVTLRLVAEHASLWNAFGDPAELQRKSRILDDWCAKVGRDPAAIERTVLAQPADIGLLPRYEAVGVQHVILSLEHPFDLAPLQQAQAQRG